MVTELRSFDLMTRIKFNDSKYFVDLNVTHPSGSWSYA
jgi:hypothetical protein